MASGQRSAILRAEIERQGGREVTCALEMTEESIFLVSESLPPLGDRVTLHLSFPRTLKPLVIDAVVTQIRMASGPGSPPGYVVAFDKGDPEKRERVCEMAERLRPPPSALANQALSVVLVEDNQLLRDTFAYAFERYFRQRAVHVNLLHAANAEDGWLLVRPDTNLVLVGQSSLRVGGELGTTFIARLRADAQVGRAFIVGTGNADDREAMLAAGADLFLAKPLVLKDLFCTLEFLIGGPARSEYGAA